MPESKSFGAPNAPARKPRRRAVVLLLLLLAPPLGARADTTALKATPQPQSASPFTAFVEDAARRSAIPSAWIWSVLAAESGGDPHAVSGAGALGLMQIMPPTWSDLRARLGLGSDPFDPHDNILAGAAYLRLMWERYGSPGFLAAYNAGPGRYEAWLNTGRSLPAETLAYVAKLTAKLSAASNSDRDLAPRAHQRVRAGSVPTTAKPPGLTPNPSALTPRADGLFVRAIHADPAS